MTDWQAVARTEDTSTLTNKRGAQRLAPTRQRSLLSPILTHVSSILKWLQQKRTQQIAARRLKITETVSLGEKRFVSILHVDGAQFLIGGAAGNVSLLAILDNKDEAANMAWRQPAISTQVPS